MVSGQLVAALPSTCNPQDSEIEQRDDRKESVLYQDLMNDLMKLAKCPFRENLAGKLENKTDNDQRDNAVSSMRCLNQFYNFSSQTFATAVQYLDFVLSKVKVQNKYLSCLVAACHYISTKINEEPEDTPSATELSHIHRKMWKASDLKRMELVVLQKMNWKLWPVTCSSILKHICDIMSKVNPSLPSSLLDDLLQKFEVCINYNNCVLYTIPTLCLSLVQLHLKESDLLTPALSLCLLQLHELCDVGDSEFYECYESVTKILYNYCNYPSSHPACLPLPKPQPRINLMTRPSAYGDTDLPTIYENPVTTIYVSTSDSDESPVIKKEYDSWSYCVLPRRCSITAE
ncbi:cyclin-G2-like [Mytilus trossulus]|uniref:cyclin-G2-like n=1 Tax=Mytilus trossulus TaxID=6551 RepID=UPI003003F93A